VEIKFFQVALGTYETGQSVINILQAEKDAKKKKWDSLEALGRTQPDPKFDITLETGTHFLFFPGLLQGMKKSPYTLEM
jgi:hypothetical protein